MKQIVEEETVVLPTTDNDELPFLLSRDRRRGSGATAEDGTKMHNNSEDFSPQIANINLWKTSGHIDTESRSAHGQCGAAGMALKRGDIVFWRMKKFSAARRAVMLGQWGNRVAHVTIACGDGDKVFEATPDPQRASGHRAGVVIAELEPSVATYHVFRHVNQEAAALFASIAEGYVALHNQLADKFGRFSKKKVIETFLRGGHGGQPKQWGEARCSILTDPVFYCSSYVIRVLLAAQQTVSEEVSFIDESNKLPVYSAPAQLHKCLKDDEHWAQIHENALYRELSS